MSFVGRGSDLGAAATPTDEILNNNRPTINYNVCRSFHATKSIHTYIYVYIYIYIKHQISQVCSFTVFIVSQTCGITGYTRPRALTCLRP